MMDARVADGAAVLQNEAAIISSELMCVEDDQFPWRSMMSPVQPVLVKWIVEINDPSRVVLLRFFFFFLID